MNRRTSPKTFIQSSELRHHLTGAEIRLWHYLRKHQLENVHFRRQHAIGPYIVDFCAPRHKLIVEVDGAQHREQREYDQERTAFLETKRYRVLRFWNREVEEDIERVIRDIMAALRERTPT